MQYQPLEMAFSTADAEQPELHFQNETLRCVYWDWRGKTVELVFHDVIAFSWDVGDAALDENHRNDCAYVMSGSTWLLRHLESGSPLTAASHRHFKLCFNEIGVLQVLASRIEILS